MKPEHITIENIVLPTGFSRLRYIEATGTQYIATGYYVGGKKTRIVGEMTKTYATNDLGVFFGCGSPNDNQWFINPYFSSTNGIMTVYMIGIGFVIAIYNALNTPTHFDCTVDIPNNTCVVELSNGENMARCKLNTLGTIYNANFHLFSSIRGTTIQNKVHAKLSSFLIYENDLLVHNYIPALRDSDSKPGLYDVVAGEFKVNNGTGEFLYA